MKSQKTNQAELVHAGDSHTIALSVSISYHAVWAHLLFSRAVLFRPGTHPHTFIASVTQDGQHFTPAASTLGSVHPLSRGNACRSSLHGCRDSVSVGCGRELVQTFKKCSLPTTYCLNAKCSFLRMQYLRNSTI